MIVRSEDNPLKEEFARQLTELFVLEMTDRLDKCSQIIFIWLKYWISYYCVEIYRKK